MQDNGMYSLHNNTNSNHIIIINKSIINGIINEIIVSNDTMTDDYNLWKTILLGVLLTIAALLTITGNVLVFIAFLRERYMRKNLTNWFLVSLAIADLLVGIIVMPFAIYHTLYNAYWPFGRDWCDIWHAFDVLSSTASILNLCAIALERYWATENPITHTSMRTRRHCLLMLTFVWICSVLISFPAIFWWRNTQDYDISSLKVCQFTSDSIYLFVSSCVSFYIPLVVMLVVYARIYRTANNLMKSFKTGEKIVYSNPKQQSSSTLNFQATNMSNEKKQKHWLKHYHSKIKTQNFITPQIGARMILRVHRGGNATNKYSNRSNNTFKTTKLKTHPKPHCSPFNYSDKGIIKRKKMNDLTNLKSSLCLNKHNINTMSNINTRSNMISKSCVLSNSIIPSVSKFDNRQLKSDKNHWNHTNSLMQIPIHSQILTDSFNNHNKLTNNPLQDQINFKRSYSFSILSCLSHSQDSQRLKKSQYLKSQILPFQSSIYTKNPQALQFKQWNSTTCQYEQNQFTDYQSNNNIDKKYSKNHSGVSSDKCKHPVARLSMNQQNINNISLMNYTTANFTLVNVNTTTMTSNSVDDANQIKINSLSKTKCWINQLREFARKKCVCKFAREQKAAKTLGIIMGLFIICWLPFFVCNILIAFNPYSLNQNNVFKQVHILVTWLGYINSCINPIIYAHSMHEFRRAFKRLLCFHWWYRKKIQLRKSTSFKSRCLSHRITSHHHHNHSHHHRHHHHHHHCRHHQHDLHQSDDHLCKYKFETIHETHQPTQKYPSVTDYQLTNCHLLHQDHENSYLSYSILVPNLSDSICS